MWGNALRVGYIRSTYSGWFSRTVITHAKGKREKSGEDDFVKLANAYTLPDIRKLITHKFEGVEAVPTAVQTAGKAVDESGSLVVKPAVDFPRKARF
jgi:hypothetical protein